MRTSLAAALLISLSACTGYEPIGKASSVNTFTGDLRTQPALEVTPSIEISTETAFGAPNWTIKERPLNQDTFYIALTARSFRTGGDGESIQIIKRRALQLQRERGYAGYRILDYTEGIESSTPLTHRVSEGTIQLVDTQLPAQR